MDYKKLIKSREVRLEILKFLSFIPDTLMLRLQYWIKTGRQLNLKNPKRYSEKLQWYKLYHKDPLMVQCVDKYDVRDYVRERGLGHILNECYGVYDRVEDIDFDKLPNQFVLKDTLGGGGNSVILVKDKTQEDLAALKIQLRKWINEDHRVKSGGREWPYYSGKKHRIIVEKFLQEQYGGLTDYKLFCFNGCLENVYIRTVYMADHDAGCMSWYDREFNYLRGVGVNYYHTADCALPVPDATKRMVEYAECLSKAFPHARVDFYLVEDRVYFGEITFFHASGHFRFEPDSFDYEMGEKFKLPAKDNGGC